MAKKKRKASPLQADPTRTGAIRRRFAADVRRRFSQLRRDLFQLIVQEDAFGLKKQNQVPTVNTRWRPLTDEDKLAEFDRWLEQKTNEGVLQQTQGEAWTVQYTEDAYKKGQGRGFDDTKPNIDFSDLGQGVQATTKAQFLQASLGAPISVERVRALAARTFGELKGLTGTMRQQLGRELADGLIRGLSPQQIARNIRDRMDKLEKRALTIARTEVVRAHAEGQLDAMERLGVDKVGVMVEWDTAGDDLVCPLCSAMSGEILTIQQARMLIPRHPNCRCAWIPYIEEGKRRRSPKKAIDESIRREIPKRTRRSLRQQKKLTPWPGADVKFRKARKVKA